MKQRKWFRMLSIYSIIYTVITLLNSVLYLCGGIYEDPSGNWHELDRAIILLIGAMAFVLCTSLPIKPPLLRYVVAYIPSQLLTFAYVWFTSLREPLAKTAYQDIWINFTGMFIVLSVANTIVGICKKKRSGSNVTNAVSNLTHILVVDDEKELADVLEFYLTNDGYTVHKCYTGTEALACIARTELDLAILDIMLPDTDGFQICKKIREKSYCPIIMLTAKTANEDKIMGLTIGADDYITKPFHPLEVVARVKTQLRRCRLYNGTVPKKEEPAHEYDIRGLTINRDSHKCFLFGKELQLTPIEFSVLWYLCQRQGVVVPSEELFEAVWGEKYLKNNNTVMAHIGRLREKLEEPARNPRFIKTIWGVGYTIEK